MTLEGRHGTFTALKLAVDELRILRTIPAPSPITVQAREAKMQLDAPDISDEAQRAAIEIAISDCVQRFYAKA